MPGGFSRPDHLPNLRGGEPSPAERLPRQRRGTTPQMHGRYPDFDVLEQAGHWDEATRKVVLDRVHDVPSVRFFTPEEARCLRAFCDAATAQGRDPKIPVLEMVDAKLFEGRLDGFRYDDMPDDREVWRIVARGLDETARARGSEQFAATGDEDREAIVADFAAAKLSGGAWDELNVKRAFSIVMRGVVQAFYSHPWAWNEIGFGGPAYPRGYVRLAVGQRESWEGAPAAEAEVDAVRDVDEQGLP
jgi:hypothetical protein